ncbi:hypothetical protein NMG60_11002165 [Bertholletia excelsa]
MDSNRSADEIGPIDPPEARSESVDVMVGEKRPAENGQERELALPAVKKARSGGGLLVGNVRKVAEIVLVLAAMGKMRGGRSPSSAEREMMVEARKKLAEVCEEFAPKDIFPRDAFGAVIEDLGLNKLREQRLGFRPPKMSISEKFLLSKQKMEKSDEFSLRAAANSCHRLPMNMGASAESRGTSQSRIFPSDKSSQAPISSGSLQSPSTPAHISAGNSTSLPYQLPTSEVRVTMVSSGLPNNLLGKESSTSALPRLDKPHFRLDSRSNGSYSSQIQVNTSGDHTLLKPPAGSQQSQTAPSGRSGPDNKVLLHHSVKVEGNVEMATSRMAPQAAMSKPLINQTASGHPMAMHQHAQGSNFSQASSLSNVHIEIGKIVQRLLQPRVPEHPTWTPPSRDYMNKVLTCQICKITINEVENVLICDACEKGYHLKCLHSHNQKAVPRGEWHCFKCLSLSNGKPLPPKYGRVTRNITAPKVSSNAPAVQLSQEKTVGAKGEMGNQLKIMANGGSGFEGASAGIMGNNPNHSASTSNMPSASAGIMGNDPNHAASTLSMPNAREMKGNDILSNREKECDNHHVGMCENDAIRTSGSASVSSAAGSSIDRSYEEPVKIKGQLPSKSLETCSQMLDHLKFSSNPQDNDQKGLPNGTGTRFPVMLYHDNNLNIREEKSYNNGTFGDNPNEDAKKEEQGIVSLEPSDVSETVPARGHGSSSSDGSNNIDWVGDVVKVMDEKTYYQSCCINGILYKVLDHVLFRANNDKLMPSKLQAMWEDNKTGSKWVVVNLCYFPVDLPEPVGRPCSPESNEVYESNHGSTVMASSIQGPCEVLPPGKFIEEKQKRSCLGTGANDGLRPLFLCKWFYDAKKGVFRDVSC